MDRRFAVLRVIEEGRALDTANDVLALSQEGRVYLTRIHGAVRSGQVDWDNYLVAADRVNDTFKNIGRWARQWADDVTEAPQISPDQLPLLLAA